ncbi:MAG: nickel pincer cofactor biosynthesis protein LarB [Myxococcota bacterium]
MERGAVRSLLEEVRTGRRGVEEVADLLTAAPAVARLPYATVDLDRAHRTGVPEVVYGAGKTGEEIAGILEALLGAGQDAVATRVDADKAAIVRARVGDRVRSHPLAEVLVARAGAEPARVGRIGVIDAGTSDRRVSEEVAVVADALGNEVLAVHDVGVAGLHRILGRLDDVRSCRVVVVVAGMDGALPGVVAGLVRAPVIAVPTSVGYGASFGGLAALLTMLNACAPGVSVVNIDNGFGAAYCASLVNHLASP